MPKKIGAGGEPQEFNEESGRYGDSTAYNSQENIAKALSKSICDKAIKNISGKYLTKQELAIFSEKIANNRHGDYVKKIFNGDKVLAVKNKAVFCNGTFEEPIITRIIEFDNNLELTIFMEII